MDNSQPIADPHLRAHHSEVALARSRCTGSRGSGRHRRRGSPFAALSDAYKPPRWVVPSYTGRGGGEVVALRTSTVTRPIPLERLAADSRHLQQDRYAPPTLSSPPAPLRVRDQSAVKQWQAETTNDLAIEPKRGAADVCDDEMATPAMAENVAVAGSAAAPVSPPTSKSLGTRRKRPDHKRRVTWAGTVETIEVARTSSCDVFSPDLHSMEIAKRLAILAEEPELTRAVEAVVLARRQAAGVIRSLTARHGWNGSLDGVEEACRLWTWREGAVLRETDELVRCVVSVPGVRVGEDVSGANNGAVWSLKATYRAARRRMEHADSD